MKEQGKRQEAKEMLKERKAMSKDTEAMMPFPGGIAGYAILAGILIILVVALWLMGLLLAGVGAVLLGLGGYVLLGFSPLGAFNWPAVILGVILAIIGIIFLGVF